MASLAAAIRVSNIPISGDPSSSLITSVSYLRIHWKLGSAEDCEYRVVGDDIAGVTPGLAPTTTRIVELSIDGGLKTDCAMLSTGAQMHYDLPMYAGEQGTGCGSVLGTTPVARQTAQQITVGDCFNGVRNKVKTTSGDMIAPNNIIPDFQGLDKFKVGIPNSQQDHYLHFNISVDQVLRPIRVNIDMNRQYIIDAVTHVIERMGSQVDPQHAQFYIDSGQFPASGPANQFRTVVIGNKPSTPHLTFDGVSTGDVPDIILRGTTAQGQNQQMAASAGFKGGQTTHGLPQGGKLTRIVTLNHAGDDATGDYRSGLPVVGVYINRDQGGVGFLPGDGAYHPMSQAMGVNDLWYNQDDSTPSPTPTLFPGLYAATDLGVYAVTADPAAGQGAPWPRLGNMALKTTKLCVDNGYLYALVEFVNTGVRHILRYKAGVTGSPASTIHGYDGWDDVFTTGDLTDFSVSGMTLYYLAGTSPRWANTHTIGSSSSVPDPRITLQAGDTLVATGLDVMTAGGLGGVVTGMFVRTSGGGQGKSTGNTGTGGLFYIAAGSTSALSAGAGLYDAFGAPVMVNRICQHPAGVIKWSTGARTVKLVACTNQGPFVSDQDAGNNWARTTGQNNLGDINLQDIASAPPRTWLGRMMTRFWAINDQSIYCFNNGLINGIDITAELLDAGPAFFADWKQQKAAYPNNTDTTLLFPDPKKGPYQLIRQLDGIGAYDYMQLDPASAAPAGAHRYAEIPTISAPALVPEIQASRLLLDAEARFLSYVSRAQTIVTIQSVFNDTGDPLRTLRPTHMALVDGTFEECFITDAGPVTIGYVTYNNLVMFVLEHELVMDAAADPGSATTTTRLGVFLLEDRSDPNRVVGDLSYAQSRTNLYTLQGRR